MAAIKDSLVLFHLSFLIFHFEELASLIQTLLLQNGK
jgi:hypothetical protein